MQLAVKLTSDNGSYLRHTFSEWKDWVSTSLLLHIVINNQMKNGTDGLINNRIRNVINSRIEQIINHPINKRVNTSIHDVINNPIKHRIDDLVNELGLTWSDWSKFSMTLGNHESAWLKTHLIYHSLTFIWHRLTWFSTNQRDLTRIDKWSNRI